MRLFHLVTRKQIQRYNNYWKRQRSKRFVLNHLKFVHLSYVSHNHNSVPCRYSKQLFSSVLCRTFNVKSIHLFAQKKNEHILVEWLLIADKGDFSGKHLLCARKKIEEKNGDSYFFYPIRLRLLRLEMFF